MHAHRILAPLLKLGLGLAMSASALAAARIEPGEYDLTAQTVLPHLEEALRYAVTRTRRCLSEPEPTSLFPLLEHQAFAGCRLEPSTSVSDAPSLVLTCKNPEAATGTAQIEASAAQFSAILELKMGGKNMTLSQRIYGRRVGLCSSPGTL